MSFSRSAYAKSCDGFVPQETDFKRLALVLSSASACKKLAMVSSLKTMFQKRPMAPTFLSSSTTRRHNNARPPPAHTVLSAAAERSSYGYSSSFLVIIKLKRAAREWGGVVTISSARGYK